MQLNRLSLLQLALLWTFALVMSPLLLLQGIYVRRSVARLPEGAGANHGTCDQKNDHQGEPNKAKSIRLVGYGDSVIAGVGVEQMSESLCAEIARHLAREKSCPVDWQAKGSNGEKSAELLVRLTTEPVESADYYVVSIGVNDVTGLTGLVKWQFNVAEIVAALRQRKPTRVVLLGVPPMDRFPALPQPLRWSLGVRAAMLNKTLSQVADLLDDVIFLDLSFELDDDHLASDGYHPNRQACQEMAQQLAPMLNTSS